MGVASSSRDSRPTGNYVLSNEQVELLVDALEMRREYLAVALRVSGPAEETPSDADAGRDLDATEELLERLRAALRAARGAPHEERGDAERG